MIMNKISVIVPVYNVEEYLEECIYSVLSQTYRNFEIILVDDGSSDESAAICDHMVAENADCMTVLHKCNQGPLLARIDGIKMAQGDIVLFLDGDDTFQKSAFEQIVDCFRKNNCDLVLFDAGTTKSFPCFSKSHSLIENVVYCEGTKKQIYNELINYGIPNGVCLKAIKKKRIALPENYSDYCDVRYGEDLLMSAHFISKCEKIVYLKAGLYHYRVRQGSAVHSFDIHRKDSIKTVHTELEKCIDEWGMPELKPLHNLRKVRGWMETLAILLKNKSAMSNAEFHNQLITMAEDPYFLTAYSNLDKSGLPRHYQFLSSCLAKKQYYVLHAYGNLFQAAYKLKSGR